MPAMNQCDICSDSKSTLIWRVDGYNIMRCPNCGLIYANVTQNDITNAYEKDYYKSVYPDYESDKNIHDLNNAGLLQDIEKYFSPGTMLEIGSAFGFFLEMAGKRGWKTTGYETSEYASQIAREKYHQNVKNEDFLTSEIQSKVEVICMFDTIEHLLKPSLFIEKISKTISKGGGFIVTTGDISSWMAKIQGTKWRMVVPPLHVYYYSPKTLSRLLEQHGFEILSIRHAPKYQNLNSLFSYQFGIKKDAIPQIPVKVNFWDIMQVIAKKC